MPITIPVQFSPDPPVAENAIVRSALKVGDDAFRALFAEDGGGLQGEAVENIGRVVVSEHAGAMGSAQLVGLEFPVAGEPNSHPEPGQPLRTQLDPVRWPVEQSLTSATVDAGGPGEALAAAQAITAGTSVPATTPITEIDANDRTVPPVAFRRTSMASQWETTTARGEANTKPQPSSTEENVEVAQPVGKATVPVEIADKNPSSVKPENASYSAPAPVDDETINESPPGPEDAAEADRARPLTADKDMPPTASLRREQKIAADRNAIGTEGGLIPVARQAEPSSDAGALGVSAKPSQPEFPVGKQSQIRTSDTAPTQPEESPPLVNDPRPVPAAHPKWHEQGGELGEGPFQRTSVKTVEPQRDTSVRVWQATGTAADEMPSSAGREARSAPVEDGGPLPSGTPQPNKPAPFPVVALRMEPMVEAPNSSASPPDGKPDVRIGQPAPIQNLQRQPPMLAPSFAIPGGLTSAHLAPLPKVEAKTALVLDLSEYMPSTALPTSGAAPGATVALTSQAAAPSAPQHSIPTATLQNMAASVLATPSGALEIALYPEELGQLRLVLSSGEGGHALLVSVEREETLQLLKRHEDDLARAFKALGYEGLSLSFENSGRQAGEEQERAPRALTVGLSQDPVEETIQPPQAIVSTRLDVRL